MARKEIKGPITDETLNSANHNFKELYAEYINAGLNASEALSKINQMTGIAESALDVANTSNDKSDDTQQQLDNIVLDSGTSDAEVIQARGNEPLLKDRLNKTDQQLADTAEDLELIGYNAKRFGVMGDGIIDDSDALNLALSTIAQNGGGTLRLEKGTYLISKRLKIGDNTNIEGEGKYNTTIKVVETSGLDYVTYIQNKSNISFKNLAIEGYKVGNSLPTGEQSGTGIRFELSSGLEIVNCRFHSFYNTGVTLRDASSITVTYSEFHNINTNGIAFTRTIKDLEISNNTFTDCYYQNINGEHHSYDRKVERVRIKFNHIVGANSGWAINMSDGEATTDTNFIKYHDCEIHGNNIDSVIVAINLKLFKGIVVSENTIKNTIRGIVVRRSTGVNNLGSFFMYNTIDCVLSNDQSYGMSLVGLKDSLIQGNKIKNTGLRGVELTLENSNFENNIIESSNGEGVRLTCRVDDIRNKILNNTIKHVTTYGIRISAIGSAENIKLVIKNNNFIDDAETNKLAAGIAFISLVSELIIEDNIFEGVSLAVGNSNRGSNLVIRNNDGFDAI